MQATCAYMSSSLPHLSRNPSLLTGHTTTPLPSTLFPMTVLSRPLSKVDQIHRPHGPETAVAYQPETAKYLGAASSLAYHHVTKWVTSTLLQLVARGLKLTTCMPHQPRTALPPNLSPLCQVTCLCHMAFLVCH